MINTPVYSHQFCLCCYLSPGGDAVRRHQATARCPWYECQHCPTGGCEWPLCRAISSTSPAHPVQWCVPCRHPVIELVKSLEYYLPSALSLQRIVFSFFQTLNRICPSPRSDDMACPYYLRQSVHMPAMFFPCQSVVVKGPASW